MKNSDLYGILNGLKALTKESGASFSYKVSKNIKIITDELTSLEETLKPSEGYIEYEKKRVELCKKFCRKDADGNDVIEGNNFVIDNQKAFDKALEKLQKDDEVVIAEFNKQKEDYNVLMLEEVSEDVSLRKIRTEELPETMTSEKLSPVIELISE